MLLLKKKKYAAVKVEAYADGSLHEVLEAKGLDIVRRDWCPLSKETGNFALQAIMSGEAQGFGVLWVLFCACGLLEHCAP